MNKVNLFILFVYTCITDPHGHKANKKVIFTSST